MQLIEDLGLRSAIDGRLAAPRDVGDVPIAMRRDAGGAHFEPVTGCEFRHLPIDRAGGGHAGVAQIARECAGIDRAAKFPERTQGLELGREREHAAQPL